MIKQAFIGLILFLFSVPVFSSEYEFSGTHYIASYVDCDHQALCDLQTLRDVMIQGVEASGATLLNLTEHVFLPDSITMVLLLSESHASIHTYPEHDSCYVDLFTCGDSCDYRKFEEVLQKYLCPKSIEIDVLRR